MAHYAGGGRNRVEGLNHQLFYLLEESFRNVCQKKKFSKTWIYEADKIIDELSETANPTKYFRLIEYKGRLGLLRASNRPYYGFEDYNRREDKRFIPLHSSQQKKSVKRCLNKRIFSTSLKNSQTAIRGFLKEEFYYCLDSSRKNSMSIMLRIKQYSPLIISSDTSFRIGK